MASAETFFLTRFFRLARQMVEAVARVHDARIIHNHINPANTVFNPETEALKLFDFGLATTLSRETPGLKSPHALEGTLEYISPEQTGRMNRAVDYRTDFYSLGVAFYELLTGCLPFAAGDALELVHCHLVKMPVGPRVLNPAVLQVLSNVVMKLLAKTPEDRYQSASGLEHDLKTCEDQCLALVAIPDFELGLQDRAECFLIPEKL